MKLIYVLVAAFLIAAAANFFYGPYTLPCNTPIKYSIGEFDARFEINRTEALAALAAAEAVWEDVLGDEDIFVYEDNAPLSVNFIYDERQEEADALSEALADLDTRGEANEVLVELHNKLVTEYDRYEAEYNSLYVSYESDLAAYNTEVELYNKEGGAPPDEYARLEAAREDLDERRDRINYLGDKLDELSNRINDIGTKGNSLINEYNERVNNFNNIFVHDEEFTQGDYQSRKINIYSFTTQRELVLVLAHEMGHALSLDHVDNPASIMYYLMGEQTEVPSLSTEDLTEYRKVCEAGLVDRIRFAIIGRNN